MSNVIRKVLVKSLNYNGREVLFMMKCDDFRLSDTRLSSNYIILDSTPRYIHKERRLVSSHGVFKVFSDWSLSYAV